MNLPDLPDLDNFEKPMTKNVTQKTLKVNKEIPQNEELSKLKKVSNTRPKMPKSQYDSDGNPILTTPDLNDINLFDEIDKYFGQNMEDE